MDKRICLLAPIYEFMDLGCKDVFNPVSTCQTGSISLPPLSLPLLPFFASWSRIAFSGIIYHQHPIRQLPWSRRKEGHLLPVPHLAAILGFACTWIEPPNFQFFSFYERCIHGKRTSYRRIDHDISPICVRSSHKTITARTWDCTLKLMRKEHFVRCWDTGEVRTGKKEPLPENTGRRKVPASSGGRTASISRMNSRSGTFPK